MSLTPLKYLNSRFCKIINPEISIHRYHLIKPHLVCTFYNKQINAKKYEWKFGSVQILMARECMVMFLKFRIYIVCFLKKYGIPF